MAEKKEKKIEEEMVQVKKTDLDSMLSRLDSLTKNQDLLFKAQDKNRLSKAMNDGKGVLIHTTKVSKWDDTGKYVIGWKLSTNKCEVVQGRWIEEQNATVIFEEGEPITVPLLEFYRKTIKKDTGEIISRENKDGNEILTIQFLDGKKLLINSNYIN